MRAERGAAGCNGGEYRKVRAVFGRLLRYKIGASLMLRPSHSDGYNQRKLDRVVLPHRRRNIRYPEHQINTAWPPPECALQ